MNQTIHGITESIYSYVEGLKCYTSDFFSFKLGSSRRSESFKSWPFLDAFLSSPGHVFSFCKKIKQNIKKTD